MNIELPTLNLPPYPFKISRKETILYIFDEIRKKHLVLSPEEWVRQHFIKFLIHQKGFPATLLQIEGGLKLLQRQKRSDILAYSPTGQPLLLVECKAPSVTISQATFDQAARYNQVLQAPWIALSNGLDHYFAEIDFDQHKISFLPDLPDYNSLNKKRDHFK